MKSKKNYETLPYTTLTNYKLKEKQIKNKIMKLIIGQRPWNKKSASKTKVSLNKIKNYSNINKGSLQMLTKTIGDSHPKFSPFKKYLILPLKKQKKIG